MLVIQIPTVCVMMIEIKTIDGCQKKMSLGGRTLYKKVKKPSFLRDCCLQSKNQILPPSWLFYLDNPVALNAEDFQLIQAVQIFQLGNLILSQVQLFQMYQTIQIINLSNPEKEFKNFKFS